MSRITYPALNMMNTLEETDNLDMTGSQSRPHSFFNLQPIWCSFNFSMKQVAL